MPWLCWAVLGCWDITDPLSAPCCHTLQDKRKEVIPVPPFLHSKQLESGTHGSAPLAPAAIEFPLLVSLASGSFTFCKVASLLPCAD